MSYPTITPSGVAPSTQGFSNWSIAANRAQTAQVAASRLSSLMKPNLGATSRDAPVTAASANAEFVSLIGKRSAKSRGISIQRTLLDRERAIKAVAGGTGSQTARPTTMHQPHRPGAQQSHEEQVATDIKLSAAEAQSKQQRDRIAQLERQLHVALAANKQQQQSRSHTASNTAPAQQNPVTPMVDHFPLPPIMPQTAGSRPYTNMTTKERSEEKTSATFLPSTAPAMHIFPRSRTAATAFFEPQQGAQSEVAGLHQLLDEYESLFEQQSASMTALKKENEKLKLQLTLANSLTGLVEGLENQAATASATKDDSNDDTQLTEPIIPKGTTKRLKQGLHSVQSAPIWLTSLLEAQAGDPTPQQQQQHQQQHASYPGPVSSPLSTQARVWARGEAFKYILSTLSPHLNVRDRCITVLMDEFQREHSWLSQAFAQQGVLLNALVDHLRKKDLGLDSQADRQAGLEFFKRQEIERQARHQAEVQAQAMAQAQKVVLWRGGGGLQPHPPSSAAAAPPTSGLVPGSAGAISRVPPTLNGKPGAPTPAAPVEQPRNQPVQVDGGGSHSIALGTNWLPDSSTYGHGSHRPFQHVPSLHETAEGLKDHLVRFVMGAGIDVPLVALREEHTFHREQLQTMRGFSDTPGGTVNVDPTQATQQQLQLLQAQQQQAAQQQAIAAAQQASQSSARPRTSGSESDEDDSEEPRQSKGYFRERTGEKNIVPASVKKWASVDQLDYITSSEYSSDTSSRKPRVKAPLHGQKALDAAAASASATSAGAADAAPVRERERGQSRAYTQTALGALSEHAPEDLDAESFQLRHPLDAGEELKGTGSKEVAEMEQQRLEQQKEQERLEMEKIQAEHTAHIHRMGASSHNSRQQQLTLQVPTTPSLLSVPTPNSALSMSPAVVGPGFGFANTMQAPVSALVQVAPQPAVVPTMPVVQPVIDQPQAPSASFSIQSEYVPLGSLKLLYDLMKFISFKLQHTQQLKHVVHAVRKMVGSDRVTLWFVDHYRQHIWSTIGTAVTNEIRVKLGVGIAGGVAASGKAVTMTNATYDQRFLKKVESGTDYITRAVMAIPLKTPRNQTFAVLQIMNKERVIGVGQHAAGGGYFTRTDELLAHTTCQHLAQNLWASEMYQIALREKLKTQSVFQHADQLLSCLDVKEMLSSLVARTRMLMDADYAVLFALSSNALERELAGGLGEDSDDPPPLGEQEDSPKNSSGSSGSESTRGSLTGPLSSSLLRPGSSASGGTGAHGVAGKKSKKHRLGPSHPWSDDPSEPVKEELLTITESCTSQIAIIIPQGYASDRRGEGFKFNTIRVPLSSGGLAAQVVKSGRTVNIFDTRLDGRFNNLVDEYISDTIGGPGGASLGASAGGKSQHCTRAFVAIPITGVSAAQKKEPDGVLVLGKLIPKAFQEWEIAELAELNNLLWMGVRRYRQDRLANLKMHDRLTSINRMVAHLDLEAGGSGVVLGSDDDSALSAALAKGAVVVTSEGASLPPNSMVGKMKDPVSGEILPTLAEYQRSRLLFPSAPQMGSTLADVFFRNELTKSADNPYGTLLTSAGVMDGVGPTSGGTGGGGVQFLSSRPADLHADDEETLESEMRDPRAPPLSNAEKAKHKHGHTSSKPLETLTLQRETDSNAGVAAVGADEDIDDELTDDEGIFSTPGTRKRTIAPAPPVVPQPQPLKPLDYSKATFTAPIPAKQGAPTSLLPGTIPQPDEPPVPITSYKPHITALVPDEIQVAEKIDAFHQATLNSVTSKSDGSSGGGTGVVFNDAAGSYVQANQIVSGTKTVSRIALKNITDFPEVDAIKTVTYKQ